MHTIVKLVEITPRWSFGVLVWEISTLGGCPYPGIAIERLHDLLTIQGYRMSRPTGCPRSLYEIMTFCWHIEPSQRPNFVALVRWLTDRLNNITVKNETINLEETDDIFINDAALSQETEV
jgi:hypothetical protein